MYRQSIAAVQRKLLADAVVEFCDARRPKGVSQDGKRSVLSPVYVQDTERQLNEFAVANIGADVCDLTKQHLDLFIESHVKLSAKSRNHYRATLGCFLAGVSGATISRPIIGCFAKRGRRYGRRGLLPDARTAFDAR